MGWIFAIYFVILIILIVLVSLWSAKKRKQKESRDVQAKQTAMMGEQCKEKRKQVFAQYPELGRFVIVKERLFCCFSVLIVAIEFLRLLSTLKTGPNPMYFMAFLVGCIFQVAVLAVVTSSNWKFALLLYLWFFYNIAVFVSSMYQYSMSFSDILSNFEMLFQRIPVVAFAECLSIVYVLLLLPLAIWLTLVPKNRRLADRQRQLEIGTF